MLCILYVEIKFCCWTMVVEIEIFWPIWAKIPLFYEFTLNCLGAIEYDVLKLFCYVFNCNWMKLESIQNLFLLFCFFCFFIFFINFQHSPKTTIIEVELIDNTKSLNVVFSSTINHYFLKKAFEHFHVKIFISFIQYVCLALYGEMI